jgi:hypothetical protein
VGDATVLSKLRGRTNTDRQAAEARSGTGHGGPGPTTELTVSSDFGWSLEVRRESELVGTMHGNNPMALIAYFREYTVLFGDPAPGYEVMLSHNPTNRTSVLGYLRGEEHWKRLLRELDPGLDQASLTTVNGSSRTSMTDAHGRPVNADSVFEEAFGIG